MATKETEPQIYSISGIHRSTNEKKLENKLLAKRSRAVSNVAVGVPADPSNNVDASTFGDDLTVIPNIKILRRADSVTGTKDDTAQQQQSDSSTDSNDSNAQSEESNDITSLDNGDSSTTADNSKASATSKSNQATTTKDNGKPLTTHDQVIAPVFLKKVA